MNRRSHDKFLDSLYVGGLILYIMAGIKLTPFHGDESTIIYMSHDWYQLAQAHDLSGILYRESSPDSKFRGDQDLRLLNGVVSKYAIGFTTMLAGFGESDLNSGWNWGEDWWVNQYYHHFPDARLLFISRISSTLLLAISIAAVFAATRLIAGRSAAWIAAFVYTMMPAVLLNGRRAMFEGANLLGIALVILVGVIIARRLRAPEYKISFRVWLLLGVVTGLAFASKHLTLLTVVPVYMGLVLVGWRHFRRTVVQAIGALLIAGIVFFVLNPAWWSAPLAAPWKVIELRQDLLSRQVESFSTHKTTEDRLLALIRFPIGQPQYFEDTLFDWNQWLGSDIAAYEASGLAGLWGPLANAIAILLMIAGLILAFKQLLPGKKLMTFNHRALVVFMCVLMVGVIGIFVLTPLAWQRYYLPLSAPLAILSGLSAGWRQYVR